LKSNSKETKPDCSPSHELRTSTHQNAAQSINVRFREAAAQRRASMRTAAMGRELHRIALQSAAMLQDGEFSLRIRSFLRSEMVNGFAA